MENVLIYDACFAPNRKGGNLRIFKFYITVGFLVRDNRDGKSKKVRESELKDLLIQHKIDINMKFTHRGFEITGKHKTGDLPVYKIEDTKKDTVRGISVYTGSRLKGYVDSSLIGIKEERDFVRDISNHIVSRFNRVLAISGLRGTGKTTGMLQAIRDINSYDEAAYISIDEDRGLSCSDLSIIIDDGCSSAKYIFIDGITRIQGFCKNSAFLYDKLCMSGRKVVISGTDSLTLLKSEESALYHRVKIQNVTLIKYTEAYRTIGQSFSEYLSMGGLYKADAIGDIQGLMRYIDTAVIDNIMNTLTKNNKITSLLGLAGIEEEKLRIMVFKILYTVIYTSTQKDKALNIQRLIDIFEYRENELDDILDMVTKRLRLDIKIIPTKAEILSVLESMEQIGFLVKALNIEYRYKSTSNEDEYKYYITNPSLTNQVLYSVVEVMKAKGYKAHVMASVKGFMGYILESVVMSHLADICNKFKYDLYYYRDSKSKEIDVVIQKEDKDIFTDDVSKYVVYEIKLTDNPDIAVLKSRWINDGEVLQNILGWAGEIKSKGILYMGESRKFEEFKSDGLTAPKNTSLKEIEEKNKGIQLINVIDFISNCETIVRSILV